MEILRSLSVLWSLFHILILFMLLYRSRYPRSKTLRLTIVCMGPLILLNVAGLILLGSELMGKLFILTCTLPSLIFFFIISEDRKCRFLFTFCMADTVALWVIIVTNLLDAYIGGGRCIVMFIGRLAAFPLLEWIAFHYVRKIYLDVQASVQKGWGIFTAMAALYYLLLAVISNFPVVITERPQELPALILILLLMPITYLTIFSSLHRQLLLFQARQREHLLESQKMQIELRLENQQIIRRLNHDIKAHFNTIKGLLENGNTQEAVLYIDKIADDSSMSIVPFCADPYINAAVSQFIPKFEQLGISFKPDIRISPLKFEWGEVCLIISNGLENAVEALAALPEKERDIDLQMREKAPYILIRLKNRCDPKLLIQKGDPIFSTKKKPGHGLGLEIIYNAAKRLDGSVSCYTENSWFIMEVMLKLKE